jgi:hypothetical protein
MNNPILVLQYPDPHECRTIAIAATRNRKALIAFKEAVLEDARLALLDWNTDDVLQEQSQLELERLERLLNLLIKDEEEAIE